MSCYEEPSQFGDGMVKVCFYPDRTVQTFPSGMVMVTGPTPLLQAPQRRQMRLIDRIANAFTLVWIGFVLMFALIGGIREGPWHFVMFLLVGSSTIWIPMAIFVPLTATGRYYPPVVVQQPWER